MIKSTKVTLKFANKVKRSRISLLITEYRRVVSELVDLLWSEEDIPILLPKTIISQVSTWLSSRMLQCAGKQASGIVRGVKAKQKKRKWVIEKLTAEGKLKQARKLQRIYNKTNITKPDTTKINLNLDSRFVKINLDNNTKFDGWVTLTSIGNHLKIILPFKATKHLNKMLSNGKIKRSITLSENFITFIFEIPDTPLKAEGEIIGVDIGQNTTISCSNGFFSKKDNHGHDLASITATMSRKKKGSKAFKRCVAHRRNYINWTIKQFNLSNVKQVNVENIKHLRYKRKTNRRLSHWVYTEIFDKLETHCKEQGVLVHKVNPTYTSQRCSRCGWTRKSNRKGKLFKCGQCGFTLDADLNASRNIALPLPEISRQQRLQRINRTGFYWLVDGQESIVPVVQETFFN